MASMGPQLVSCGCLTARTPPNAPEPASMGPQLTSCGPIEAANVGSAHEPPRRIRSSRAAAPLKQLLLNDGVALVQASAAHELRPH